MWLFMIIAATAPVTLTLDERAGLLYARLWKDRDTIGAGFAHDHVLNASKWSGRLTYDPNDAAHCQVSLKLPVAGLDIDRAELRKRFALPGGPSDGQRKEMLETMRDKGQLDAAKYPSIGFQSVACHGRGGRYGTLDLEGDVTIRGVAKRVRFPLQFDLADDRITAKGSFVVQHEEFGFKPYSGVLGAVKNGPDIEIGFDVAVAVPAQ